ncbi:MAG: transposase [Planctomycetales bacterium]|nr:transposase [Planctomycetales bacterium]
MNGGKKDVRDRVIAELQRQLKETQKALEAANVRLQELEKLVGASPSTKVDEPYSVESEEARQEQRGKKKKHKSTKRRSGRIVTAEKIAQAERREAVYPAGVAVEDCWLSHTRPVHRIENGRAVLVAYAIYRGPKNQFGKIPGVLGRSEYGIEIAITLAYQIYSVGLSFDKTCSQLNFFQNLKLSKSQADALLRQLGNHWESEFEVLCTLLANSMVVHTDETSWSINSVWAFLCENVRLMVFGVHKDAATLAKFLDPGTFEGTVVSDDAAVYANFSSSQKCWAHLLRKAIKLTLMDPDEDEYRRFTDRLLEIYRKACRLQKDKRYSDAGRQAKVAELDDEIMALCAPMWSEEFPPQEDETLDDYRKLNNELMRLMVDQQLFTFVTAGSATQPNGETLAVSGTNNEAERTLRNAANARKTGRTSKTARGAKRRTVIESVLESLRVHLPTFTLSSILTEIYRWPENGQSCFTELLKKLQLPPPKTSILEALFS